MANKNIWVVFELSDGKPNRVSLELMQKAASMKEKASAVIIGENAKEAAPAAFANGADEVIAVSQKATFEGAAYILSQLIKKYEPLAVLIGSTNYGRDLSAALSARSRIGIASDCTDMWINAEGDEVSINWIRPSYDGKLNTNIAVAGTPQIGTFHAGTLPYKENFGGPSDGSIIEETVKIPDGVILTSVLGFIPDDALMAANIEDAKILISGGRGVGSKEGFKQLFELAALVGGNVSGSRVAVEEGWIEKDRQVGITGKTVAPELYIAFGISGAQPHVAGMKESKVIVAVNSDANAPIFDYATYGIVADLNTVIPEMIEKIKANK